MTTSDTVSLEGEDVPDLPSPEEQNRFLDALDAAADVFITASVQPNTKRAYDGDWRVWERYCAAMRVDPLTGRRGLMVAFVDYLRHQQLAPATIDRRLAGVSTRLTEQGVDVSRRTVQAARTALEHYKRELAATGTVRGRGPTAALTVPELRQMSGWLDRVIAAPDIDACTTLLALRDRALLLVGFAMAARRSELAALRAADIHFESRGMTVMLRAGTSGADTARVPVLTSADPATCPVRAWQAWDTALREHPGEHTTGGRRAFVGLDRRVRTDMRILPTMTPGDVGEALSRVARDAGLDRHITAHALRSGLATAADQAGHDMTGISRHGRWTPGSPMIQHYVQRSREFGDCNAAEGVDLWPG
jgi:site-specific recombinase XerD